MYGTYNLFRYNIFCKITFGLILFFYYLFAVCIFTYITILDKPKLLLQNFCQNFCSIFVLWEINILFNVQQKPSSYLLYFFNNLNSLHFTSHTIKSLRINIFFLYHMITKFLEGRVSIIDGEDTDSTLYYKLYKKHFLK